MFISVEDDIICNAIDEASAKRDIALLTLRELLLALRRHKHIVFFPALTEGQMQQLSGVLTKAESGSLKSVNSMRMDLSRLRTILTNTLCVTFTIPENPDESIIYINPLQWKQLEIFEEIHLIVENIVDAEFYAEIVGENYIKRLRLPEKLKKICYYPTQGGGATIAEVVKKEQNLAQHLCLIIADSDKKYESAEEGSTAGGLRNAIQECKESGNVYCSLQKLYVLSNVCEVENLIPLGILHQVSNNGQKKFINSYRDKLSYYDIKLGLDYRMLYDAVPYAYYEEIFGKEHVWQSIKDARRVNTKRAGYELAVKDLPKFEGGVWGTTIMRNLMHPISSKMKMAFNKLRNINNDALTNVQRDEWTQIGELMYSWCCCYSGL